VNGERWLHHVDPAIARSAGLPAPPPPVPGRLCVASTGLVAHVLLETDGFDGLPPRCPGVGPSGLGVLPAVLAPDELPVADQGSDLIVGRAADDLDPVALHVPSGDHVFVAGAAATGKTTALRQLVAAWTAVHPDGAVVWVDRRRPLAEPPDPPALVVVDDADRVDDPHGVLAAVIAGRHPDVTIAAAARPEAVRAAYGHWTRDVTRSRCGLVLTAPGDVDGELLGATLPRRSVIPARPGLAWMIDARGHRLVQVAARMPA
jgi:S-DNA-T family DNA segregation ATPase FtsK/SpoIIIE